MRLLAFFLFLCLMLSSALGQNLINPFVFGSLPISIRQSAYVRNTGVTPVSVSLPSCLNGSLIVVLVFKAGQVVAATDVTDGVSAYSIDQRYTDGSNINLGALSRRTSASGSLTIQCVNTAGGNNMAMCAYELINAAPTIPLDGWIRNNGGAGTAVTSQEFNTTGQGVVLMVQVDGASAGGVTKTAGANYAISVSGAAHEDNGAVYWSNCMIERTTTGALEDSTATLTLGTSQTWNTLCMSYVSRDSANNNTSYSDFEGSTSGTIVTPTLVNSTIRGAGAWNTGPSAGQAVTARFTNSYNQAFNTPAKIAGLSYAGSGSLTVAMNNQTYEHLAYLFPVQVTNVSAGFFFTPGMTNAADSTFYDAAMFTGALDFLVFSVQMVGTAPTVPVKAHTQAGSSAGTINLTALHTYWITMRYVGGDKGYIRAYDPSASWAQVGSEISLTVGNSPVFDFRIGENHAVSPPSPTVSYYDNVVIDTVKAVWPLGP